MWSAGRKHQPTSKLSVLTVKVSDHLFLVTCLASAPCPPDYMALFQPFTQLWKVSVIYGYEHEAPNFSLTNKQKKTPNHKTPNQNLLKGLQMMTGNNLKVQGHLLQKLHLHKFSLMNESKAEMVF